MSMFGDTILHEAAEASKAYGQSTKYYNPTLITLYQIETHSHH